MKFNDKIYGKYVKSVTPSSPIWKDVAIAFSVGGGICMAAQGITELLKPHTDEKTAGAFVSIILIFIASFLTGIGVFDKIAKFAGAGTLVPITGFANAVVSPAIDNRAEGFILGLGAKMFTVAGPVIVFGVLSSCLYGLILKISELIA